MPYIWIWSLGLLFEHPCFRICLESFYQMFPKQFVQKSYFYTWIFWSKFPWTHYSSIRPGPCVWYHCFVIAHYFSYHWSWDWQPSKCHLVFAKNVMMGLYIIRMSRYPRFQCHEEVWGRSGMQAWVGTPSFLWWTNSLAHCIPCKGDWNNMASELPLDILGGKVHELQQETSVEHGQIGRKYSQRYIFSLQRAYSIVVTF